MADCMTLHTSHSLRELDLETQATLKTKPANNSRIVIEKIRKGNDKSANAVIWYVHNPSFRASRSFVTFGEYTAIKNAHVAFQFKMLIDSGLTGKNQTQKAAAENLSKTFDLANLRGSILSAIGETSFLLARKFELGIKNEVDHGEDNERDSERDSTTAAGHYEDAANDNQAESQYRLAMQCFTGRGIELDVDRAVELFTKAADSGHARAQFQLGLIYSKGLNVEMDLDKAEDYYGKSAAQGHPEAKQNLDRLVASRKNNPDTRNAWLL